MTGRRKTPPGLKRDWPTLLLALACYGGWAAATGWLAATHLWLAIPVTAVLIGLHSSLQHEMLHGHPFRSARLNAALAFPSLNLVVPYLRFKDTHLEHHRDSILTDPYDDPETNYVDPMVWETMSATRRRLLELNNTLAGRLVLGPALSQVAFMRADWDAIRDGDRRVLAGWLWHLPGALMVLAWVLASPMPFWAYALAAYGGLSILKLRTFLEHQAHASARGRTVLIEDRGPLALVFLNNNFHVVHHMHPSVPWFALPGLFRSNPQKYLRRNHGYYYRSYAEVLRRHLFRSKDPVAHPLWRGDQRLSPLPERIARRRVPAEVSAPR